MVLLHISHQSLIGMNQKSTFYILICSLAGWQAQVYSFVVKTYKNVFTAFTSDLYYGWFQPLIWPKYSFITRLLSYSYCISIYFLFLFFFVLIVLPRFYYLCSGCCFYDYLYSRILIFFLYMSTIAFASKTG